jgi:hypothetical protein
VELTSPSRSAVHVGSDVNSAPRRAIPRCRDRNRCIFVDEVEGATRGGPSPGLAVRHAAGHGQRHLPWGRGGPRHEREARHDHPERPLPRALPTQISQLVSRQDFGEQRVAVLLERRQLAGTAWTERSDAPYLSTRRVPRPASPATELGISQRSLDSIIALRTVGGTPSACRPEARCSNHAASSSAGNLQTSSGAN